jgi:squalene/oxidosqualene cyclase-like protein
MLVLTLCFLLWTHGLDSFFNIIFFFYLLQEIYTQSYDKVQWSSHRWTIAPQDLYKPHSWLIKVVMPACNLFDKWFVPNWMRNKALESTLDHIRYEDKETHYIDIGPVNKCMDMLCEFYASNGMSEAFRAHQDRLLDYLWLAKDGMKMQGYNGCQLWDTAFALQGLAETDLLPEFEASIKKAYEYVDISQVRENAENGDVYYRHISKGAWPFSSKDHGWPISDCTAEGFRAAMILPQRAKFITPLSDDRLFDAVNVMLSYQNTDGGWPTYELKRAGGWMEILNPAECFDGIMVDYSYVECTGAVLKSLMVFRKSFPNHRTAEIEKAMVGGLKYIRDIQRPDGSWHGSWAVCYTYAIWFGISTLVMAGHRTDSEVIKACQFLKGKQNADGSWGEDFKSCVKRVYVPNPAGGHVVHTAWACMSLMDAEREEDAELVRRGIEWLIKMQLPNGDWAQASIVGVFNFNCAIAYEGYKNYFPIWALGRYYNSYKYGSNFELKN